LANKHVSLQVAIDKGLASLGEPIMKTIIWHLHSRGFFMESKNIDISLFYDHLQEIIGNAADNVLEEVYTNLRRQQQVSADADAVVSIDPSPGLFSHHHKSKESDDESMISKIQQLVNSNVSAKEGLRE
jgi:hypothetical protein